MYKISMSEQELSLFLEMPCISREDFSRIKDSAEMYVETNGDCIREWIPDGIYPEELIAYEMVCSGLTADAAFSDIISDVLSRTDVDTESAPILQRVAVRSFLRGAKENS